MTVALLEDFHIFEDFFLGERVDEGQGQGDEQEADTWYDCGSIVDAGSDFSGLDLFCGVVADIAEDPAAEAAGKSLAQLAGEGIDSIDGAVIALAILDFLVVDDVGDIGLDDEVEPAHAHGGNEGNGGKDKCIFNTEDEQAHVSQASDQHGHSS